jgi:hypothetical protein
LFTRPQQGAVSAQNSSMKACELEALPPLLVPVVLPLHAMMMPDIPVATTKAK